MAESSRDPLAELEALARATDDLQPADDLTRAVLDAIDPTFGALDRAAQETEDLAPAGDFTDAVMARVTSIRKKEPGFADGLVRVARIALVGAAAAAAACVLLSTHAERVFDTAVLEGIAAVEVDP